MEILKNIKNLDELGFNKYEIVVKLKEQHFPDAEIIEGMNSYSFRKKSERNYSSLILAAVGIFLFLTIGGERSFIGSGLISRANVYVLNELVFKPSTALSLLLVSGFLMMDKSYIDKSVRTSLRFLLILTLIASIVTFSILSILLCVIAMIYFILVDLPVHQGGTDAERIVDGINKNVPFKTVLNNINLKKWEGSWVSLMLLFGACLFLDTLVKSELNIISVYDVILLYTTRILLLICLVFGVLLYVDVKRFRFFIFAVAMLVAFHMLLTVFNPQFRFTILPSAIVLISLVWLIYKQQLFVYRT